MSDTLTRLAAVLEERKNAAPDSSYVASLYHKGLNKILEKVGEESVEAIIAAKDAAASGDCQDLIYETADLWFHSLVMLGPRPASASRAGRTGAPLRSFRPRRESRPPTIGLNLYIARNTTWAFLTGNTGSSS